MAEERKITANGKEFVVMSVEGYKKLANIDTSGKNLYWATDTETEIPIKLKIQSTDGDIYIPKTIPQVFMENAERYGNDPCLHAEPTIGKWKNWTWRQTWDISFSFARSCIAYGISKRSAVNIIGFNCPEWVWSFYGAIMADCISVGVYTTNGPSACQYVAEHSSAELIVAESEKQMEKYLEVLDQLPLLKIIIVYGVTTLKARPTKIKVLTWDEFLQYGADEDMTSGGKHSETLAQRMEDQVPGKCCNIVYTSGTTGNPKGVMLTHDNMLFVINRMMKELTDQGILDGQERVVSYLPLSHSAAQVNDIMNNLVKRTQIFFARPDALQGSLVETLTYAKPTVFLGVPRVWEKMEERLKEFAASNPVILQKISGWAKGKGTLNSKAKMQNKGHPFGYSLAHFVVLGRVKKKLGLGNPITYNI